MGAGCGLLGLVLAQEWGARVVLTDTPTAAITLTANVASNAPHVKSPAAAEAKVLRWDVPEDCDGLLEELPDLILGYLLGHSAHHKHVNLDTKQFNIRACTMPCG